LRPKDPQGLVQDPPPQQKQEECPEGPRGGRVDVDADATVEDAEEGV
jgi:hypothetical protein